MRPGDSPVATGVRLELLSFLPEQGGVHWLIDSIDGHGMLGWLDALVTLLSKVIPQNFEEVITVGPHLIAKVASPLTGVPASWLLHSSKPPLKGLVSRLLRMQIGKDYPLKRASRPRPPRPVGSLLWLCGLRSGRPELAEGLAEELFDSRDSLIHFDSSEYTDPHSVSRLLGVPTSQGEFGAVGQFTEAVKKKPFSVVLFSNIDVAHASVIDTLIEISSNGKLTDGQGSAIDFTNTLVIMISSIESDKQVTFSCDCLRMMLKEFPVKEFLDHHSGKTEHLCCILPRLRKVQRQFKFQLYQQLDDIVVFPSLYVGHCKAIARLQLRDIASSMIQRGIVIYPSEAALDSRVLKASWYTVVQTGMNEEAELKQIDGPNRRAKKGVENLKARLSTGLSGQAIDIVAGAILKIIDAPQYPPCNPVASSLLLGLTPCAKAELVKELADHFITDDGENLLIQFNLVEYTDSDSLSHLMNALSRYTGSENCELQLPEAVRIRPCSILLFNQVEKAHISVFSALLSVLDDGLFNDNRGRTVDCRDTVVIITSNVGHKEIVARVVGHASENTMWEGDIKQVTEQKQKCSSRRYMRIRCTCIRNCNGLGLGCVSPFSNLT